MPYFSFSIKQNFLKNKIYLPVIELKIDLNKQYYSKNTNLFKMLSNKNFHQYINFINYEKTKKVDFIGKKILFCLPPNIGMGDAVEYALAIKAIVLKNIFLKIGVAYTGKYSKIFNNYFGINNLYEEVISKSEVNKYDTVFHFTVEINEIKNQKYIRSDIEKAILKKFNCKQYRNIKPTKLTSIKTITLFPISKSPIRSLPIFLINKIISQYSNKYKIEIILDENSIISNYIKDQLIQKSCKLITPKTLDSLLRIIQNIEFGIFPDSGPLHVAKILGKRGVLISTSVSPAILLNNFKNIEFLDNHYSSANCSSPCGLTNIFNFQNKPGCFDTHEIGIEQLLKLNNNSLQRGNLKENYLYFIKKPVGCVNNINIDNLINKINNFI